MKIGVVLFIIGAVLCVIWIVSLIIDKLYLLSEIELTKSKISDEKKELDAALAQSVGNDSSPQALSNDIPQYPLDNNDKNKEENTGMNLTGLSDASESVKDKFEYIEYV